MYYPGQQALVICRNYLSLTKEIPELGLDRFMQISFTPHPSKVWIRDLRNGEGNLPESAYNNPKSNAFLNPRMLDVSKAYDKPSSWLINSEFYRAFLSDSPLSELIEQFQGKVRMGWPEN